MGYYNLVYNLEMDVTLFTCTTTRQSKFATS